MAIAALSVVVVIVGAAAAVTVLEYGGA